MVRPSSSAAMVRIVVSDHGWLAGDEAEDSRPSVLRVSNEGGV
jgi:hypothetical protein